MLKTPHRHIARYLIIFKFIIIIYSGMYILALEKKNLCVSLVEDRNANEDSQGEENSTTNSYIYIQ